MSWIGCDFHHRRSKQAVFQHVTALQLFDNRVIRRLVRFDHFDGFVKSRIEGLTFGFETFDAKLLENVLKLLADRKTQEAIVCGKGVADLKAISAEELAEFVRVRENNLLYP